MAHRWVIPHRNEKYYIEIHGSHAQMRQQKHVVFIEGKDCGNFSFSLLDMIWLRLLLFEYSMIPHDTGEKIAFLSPLIYNDESDQCQIAMGKCISLTMTSTI